MVATNNASVVSYIDKQGGTHSPALCTEVHRSLETSYVVSSRGNNSVRHIPGRFNILAGCLSRMLKPIQTKWSLNQRIANQVFQMMGYPNIDLFATRLNNRLPVYVSPITDNRALVIGALSMNWDRIHGYAFPPFYTIPAVLNKVCQFQCRIVLVAPLWPLVMASRSATATGSSAHKSHQRSRLSGSTRRKIFASKFSNACPSRLGIIKQSITDKKFSKEVADHVSASRRLLQRRFMMQNGQFSPVGVIQKSIILSWPFLELWCSDFLLYMSREKKYQVSTVKGYRSMISNTLKFKSGINMGSDPIISELIKSFEIQRPVQKSLAPKWDMACVLSSLCKEPYDLYIKLQCYISQ